MTQQATLERIAREETNRFLMKTSLHSMSGGAFHFYSRHLKRASFLMTDSLRWMTGELGWVHPR